MSKLNLKIIFSLISILTFSSFIFVSAQVLPGNSVKTVDSLEDKKAEQMEKIQEKRDLNEQRKEDTQLKRTEKAEQLVQKRCEIAQNRVENALNRYENYINAHKNLLNNLTEKLQNLINKLNESGYDTAQLQADLGTLEGMVEKAEVTLNDYIETLKASKELTCGESEGTYREQIQNGKEILRIFKLQFGEIRAFYKDNIKPELQRIREQVRTNVQDNANEMNQNRINENTDETDEDITDNDDMNTSDETPVEDGTTEPESDEVVTEQEPVSTE